MCSEHDNDESENGVKVGKVPFQHYGGSVRTMDGVVLASIKKGVENQTAAKPKVMVGGSKRTMKRIMTTCKKLRTVMRKCMNRHHLEHADQFMVTLKMTKLNVLQM